MQSSVYQLRLNKALKTSKARRKDTQLILAIRSSSVLWSHCKQWVSKHRAIAPKGDWGLGSRQPLVTTLLLINGRRVLFSVLLWWAPLSSAVFFFWKKWYHPLRNSFLISASEALSLAVSFYIYPSRSLSVGRLGPTSALRQHLLYFWHLESWTVRAASSINNTHPCSMSSTEMSKLGKNGQGAT